MVAHSFASTSGSRSGSSTTFIPNLIRSVAPATAAIAVIGSSAICGPASRSLNQIESTSLSSHRSTQRKNEAGVVRRSNAAPSPMRTLIAMPPRAS